MNSVQRTVMILALLAPVLACPGCVGRMFSHPDHREYDTPANHGLTYEEVTFPSRDGTRLSGWFIPAVGPARGTVIHFHGNAQNMTAHFGFVDWLPLEGFNLFVFDYRGYGKSAGSPSRRGLYEDSLAALDYIRSRPGIDHDRLLVLGQSLGGAQAITAVGSNSQGIRAVAVESSFSSYRSIVKDKIGAIPVLSLVKTPLSRLLISDEFSPAEYVGRIAPVPLLIIHGTADQVVPYSQGTRLFALAREPKLFWTIEGGDHTEAFADPGSSYRSRPVTFFNQALAKRALTPAKPTP